MGKALLRVDAEALGKGQVFARRRASQRGGTAGLRLVRFAPGGALRRPPLRGRGHRGRGRATRRRTATRTAKLPYIGHLTYELVTTLYVQYLNFVICW